MGDLHVAKVREALVKKLFMLGLYFEPMSVGELLGRAILKPLSYQNSVVIGVAHGNAGKSVSGC